MQIIRGKQKTALKVVVYGPEGIGKSTFAAQFPNPLFIDTEGGTKHMDVARTPKPTSWVMLLGLVKECIADPSLCGTLIIDTMDWAELLCSRYVCDKNQKKSIEEFGYGKRAVWDAVLVSQQSALTWAETQKEPKQCGFDPYTTDTPYAGYWCAELTLHAPSNQWRVLYVTNVVTLERWFNIYNIDHWIGWRKVPLAVAPEVHNFPLANGFTGDIIYYKTQENICTVSGCIYGTFAKDSYISIGYLPEGFHSAHALELPVTASYGVGVRCSVATDGNVTVIISTSGVAYVYLNISFPCT